MSIIFDSSKTADTINRAIDNSQGTTTTTQGAAAAGKIITEDLQPVVQCTGGYTNPVTVKTISGVPPVEFHAVECTLKSWTIYGNTVEGVSVGEKTANLTNIADISETITVYYKDTLLLAAVDEGSYTLSFNTTSDVSHIVSVGVGTTNYSKDVKTISGIQNGHYDIDFSISADDSGKKLFVRFVRFGGPTTVTYTVSKIMLNTGSIAKPFEPFGFKVPITCANITYNCYISDVLRKSTPVERKRKSKKAVNDTTVYDIMDSTGTVYRYVDTDGTPLETPTTESFTAPDIVTIWGYNTVDVDTTVTPSNVEIQYYDN